MFQSPPAADYKVNNNEVGEKEIDFDLGESQFSILKRPRASDREPLAIIQWRNFTIVDRRPINPQASARMKHFSE